MKNTNLIFNERELPLYLGYGVLDQENLKFENDIIYADYLYECDGSLAHRIVWDKKRCKFDTYCQGEPYKLSSYPNLKMALQYDFMSFGKGSSERGFEFLTEHICKQGNIYVNQPKSDEKDTSLTYFPAGKLFHFSLPLLKKSHEVYNYIINSIVYPPHIKFFRDRNGLLIRYADSTNSKIECTPIVIVDFTVSLAYLVSAAKNIADSGIICSEKYLRLMVNEVYQSERSFFQTFPGDEKNPAFGICFKEIEKDKYPEMAELFELQVGLFQLDK